MVYNDVMLIYFNHIDRSKQVDYKIQKATIHDSLQQRLKRGDTWYVRCIQRYVTGISYNILGWNHYRYLVDVKWMKQWKKFVGYDQGDQKYAGLEDANPGAVDNSTLLQGIPFDYYNNNNGLYVLF